MLEKNKKELQTVTLKLPVEIIRKIDSSLEGKTRSDFIREAILDGKIPNDFDAAYEYMLKYVKENKPL